MQENKMNYRFNLCGLEEKPIHWRKNKKDQQLSS